MIFQFQLCVFILGLCAGSFSQGVQTPVEEPNDMSSTCQARCGIPGVPGNPGTPGLTGRDGIPGRDGIRGVEGLQGIAGSRGPPGVRGPMGHQGEAGIPGLDGPPGAPGLDGVPGINGERGINGNPGQKGSRGQRGAKGIKGDSGVNSIDNINMVAFTVDRSSDLTTTETEDTLIDFDHATTDLNNHFDLSTETFICKLAGVYLFTFTFGSNTANTHSVWLKRNSDNIMGTFARSDFSITQASTNTVVLNLVKGDIIQMVLEAGYSLHCGADNPCSFTGALLHVTIVE